MKGSPSQPKPLTVVKPSDAIKGRLIRVPKSLACRWRQAACGTDVSFLYCDENGTERVAALPLEQIEPPLGREDEMLSQHNNESPLEWFDIKKTKTEGMYIFTRQSATEDDNCYNSTWVDETDTPPTSSEAVTVGAVVEQSLCLIPPLSGNYKRQWKSRLLQIREECTGLHPDTLNAHSGSTSSTTGASNSTRLGADGAQRTQTFRYVSPLESSNSRGNGLRGLTDFGGDKKVQKHKRARVEVTMTTDELDRRLFEIFEAAPDNGYSLNEMMRRTGQPQAMVRNALERIADYRKSKFTLKTEFSQFKA